MDETAHEKIARELKASGNNCSKSLHMAFQEDEKLSDDFPAPRSVEGKCGALLTAIKILNETGHADRVNVFEEEFARRFTYTKCIDLMTHERRCGDYVGESARMLDELLS